MIYFKLSFIPIICAIVLCVAQNGIEKHPSWELIPTNVCGKARTSVTTRIVGGQKAALGEFPWIARIGIQQGSKFRRTISFVCGGTLISRFYVLTAAHCNVKRNDIVRLGENSEKRRNNCDSRECAPPPQDIRVREALPHNSYSSKIFSNDIMLVQLSSAVKFNDFVRPACLPRGQALSSDLVGVQVRVAGWGFVRSTDNTTPPDLMFADIPVLDKIECDRTFRGVNLTENQICAGYARGGPDSCEGDSGGPLSLSSGSGRTKRTYVVGVVSYGVEKCGRGPAVYTRVSSYLKWILDSITK